MARSFSATDGLNQGLPRESVCGRHTAGSWFRLAENVPVLRADYPSLQIVMPGVRQVARSGNKIVNFGDSSFSATLK